MKIYVIILSYCVFLLSCQDDKKVLTDTPTSGTINVLVDESFQPIMDSEQFMFQSHYPDAHIRLIYKPALEVLAGMENDSIRMIVTSIPVDSSYLYKYYKKKDYFPTTTIVAKDAVALICHHSKKKVEMTLKELEKVCLGEITDFSQLEKKGNSGKITLVFDNMKSSTVQYIQDSVLKGNPISANAFAQKTNPEVLEYVSKNPNAIGVIGVNWISDAQDDETAKFLETIVPIEMRDADSSQYYYSPAPGWIASHLYPLRRYMNVTVKEGGAGLGRGFLNFMSGEIGQRIVLKAGLVPAKVPTRVVETRPSL